MDVVSFPSSEIDGDDSVCEKVTGRYTLPLIHSLIICL